MKRGIVEHLGYTFEDGKDIIIYSEVDKFLRYNPPCKDCLVMSICLYNNSYIINYEKFGNDHIEINSCEMLVNFITDSKFFTKF
jgi:hypothetical protein